MWTKVYETEDGHQTGRWQWFFKDGRGEAHPMMYLDDGSVGHCYPGVYLWGDNICPPPGMGLCITPTQQSKRDQAVTTLR